MYIQLCMAYMVNVIIRAHISIRSLMAYTNIRLIILFIYTIYANVKLDILIVYTVCILLLPPGLPSLIGRGSRFLQHCSLWQLHFSRLQLLHRLFWHGI
jgi:hypothetical protein